MIHTQISKSISIIFIVLIINFGINADEFTIFYLHKYMVS